MVKKSEMTLEELEATTDKNRRILIQNIKLTGLDLQKYKIYKYNDFPGAIKLLDEKGRSIIVYYNYLTKDIEVIFEDLKKTQLYIYLSVSVFLVDEYNKKAKAYNINKKIVVKEVRTDEEWFRYLTKSSDNKIIKSSKKFHIANGLYDAYEYIKKEISKLHN